jgi:hypothetical protein
LRALEVGVQVLEAIVTFLAQRDVHEIQQVLQDGGIQQRLYVRALIVRGDQQRHVRLRAQRIRAVPRDRHDFAATLVERESRPFAVLVHDASVLDEPALVDAVATATRLSTANTALTDELRSQIGEAAAARRRLMLADVEERRRLECRMQDGVERRLEQLTARLESFEADDSVSDHLERAVQHLTATCTDLGQLARGLHPRELSLGLVAAVEGLIARTPLPVELHVEVRRAPPEEIAAAAYFVCAEALSNVLKTPTPRRSRRHRWPTKHWSSSSSTMAVAGLT